jgi:hypothetical protein
MVQNDWPVIPPERGDDLHNLEAAERADLVLFMAGNQFMAMADLVAAFRRAHPEIGAIFYETLPPGLELKQILAGGAVFKNRPLEVRPDIYSAVSERAMHRLAAAGHIAAGDERLYLHNRLALMVPAGNPAGVTTVEDLGRRCAYRNPIPPTRTSPITSWRCTARPAARAWCAASWKKNGPRAPP